MEESKSNGRATMSVGYQFDEKQHVHTFDGKRMYGVTSVLKNWGDPSALVNWAANQACDYIEENSEEIVHKMFDGGRFMTQDVIDNARTAHTRKRDKAGDRGTEVHAQLEVMMNDWIDDKKDFAIDEYEPIVKKVREWMFENGIKPLKSEMPVYSLTHFYAGIADGVIEKDGKKYILDFKCGSSIQTKAFLQMGAYATCYKEMFNESIDGCVLVHIPKGNSFNQEKNVYWRYDMETIQEGFLHVYKAYLLDKELQKLIIY